MENQQNHQKPLEKHQKSTKSWKNAKKTTRTLENQRNYQKTPQKHGKSTNSLKTFLPKPNLLQTLAILLIPISRAIW